MILRFYIFYQKTFIFLALFFMKNDNFSWILCLRFCCLANVNNRESVFRLSNFASGFSSQKAETQNEWLRFQDQTENYLFELTFFSILAIFGK